MIGRGAFQEAFLRGWGLGKGALCRRNGLSKILEREKALAKPGKVVAILRHFAWLADGHMPKP